ncbi:MAG: hypothetical protein ABIB93_04420 [Chloroflexota bacterium]
MRMKLRKITAIVLTCLVVMSSPGCESQEKPARSLGQILSPYRFNLALWEMRTAGDELEKLISAQDDVKGDEISQVEEYFATISRIKNLKLIMQVMKADYSQRDAALLQDELERLHARGADLESQVEQVMERQIRDALSEQGIYHPLDGWLKLKTGFPPVNFILAEPPHILVISPREKIETLKTVMLRASMSREEMESLEYEVDGLGFSSLVVRIGGIATYPAFVSNNSDLRTTIDTACEEWWHQYLMFKPLGFRYLLHLAGILPDYEIATMNETAAGMLGQEIGAIVFANYEAKNTDTSFPEPQVASDFDFNMEMREIRKAVDGYLAEGKTGEAETFMEQKRQHLAAHGYYIRKLNQAYFAFYGCYADSPTSVDPIGVELRELRDRSDSIRDFLDAVSVMTGREELSESLR